MMDLVTQLLSKPIYCLPLTIGVYFLSLLLYRKVRIGLFHPLIVTIGLIILMLDLSDTTYEEYKEGSQLIDFLLGPSVVSLGYILYEQSKYLRGRVVSIMVSLFVGSLIGILSAVGLAYALGAGDAIAYSMESRSVTTPIAIALSEQSGGIPVLTAVVVVISGIIGGVMGPPLFKWLHIESSIAKGLALGAAAHGVGTSVAIQMGALEGAIGGLAIGIMGVFTSILIPIIHYIAQIFV